MRVLTPSPVTLLHGIENVRLLLHGIEVCLDVVTYTWHLAHASMDKNKFVQVVKVNVISTSDILVFVLDPKYMRSLKCYPRAIY
jgi:hypothetical protein